MKISRRGALVIVALVVSIGANLYQFLEVRKYIRAVQRPRSFCYQHLKFTYPINGLTPEDARQILAVFDSLVKDDPSDARILSITVDDSARVVIETGFVKGPLHGGGRYFGFIKTEKGWVYDQKTKTCGWVS